MNQSENFKRKNEGKPRTFLSYLVDKVDEIIKNMRGIEEKKENIKKQTRKQLFKSDTLDSEENWKEKIQKENLALYEKIQATLKFAGSDTDFPGAQYLSNKFYKQLKDQLESYIQDFLKISPELRSKISLEKFEKLCTSECQRITREMYATMDGEEFNKRVGKWTLKNVCHAMGLSDPRNKIRCRENKNFFLQQKPLIKSSVLITARKYNFSERVEQLDDLAQKIFWHESHGDQFAVSYTYHLGFSQLGSALYQGRDWNYRDKINPFNLNEAILRGVDYIGWLFKKFDFDKIKTMTAYNVGPTALQRAINQKKNFFLQHLPNKENRLYASNVEKDFLRVKSH